MEKVFFLNYQIVPATYDSNTKEPSTIRPPTHPRGTLRIIPPNSLIAGGTR